MNAVDHNNVVIFDDRGIPSIMCRFVRPNDTEEVPAVFKIGDKVADAIYISKYPNIVIDGRAYSMPREYVAQVIIPARGYEIVDTGEKDEDGKTITKREPVPFDMKKCTLVLWALI